MTRQATVVEIATAVDALNGLLKGELAAVATYETALKGTPDEPDGDADRLLELAAAHQRSARRLRDEVIRLGGAPVDSGGVWAAFARTRPLSSNVLADRPAVRYLRECEEAGLADYEEARESLDESSRDVVDEELLPRQRRHLAALSAIAARLEEA